MIGGGTVLPLEYPRGTAYERMPAYERFARDLGADLTVDNMLALGALLAYSYLIQSLKILHGPV